MGIVLSPERLERINTTLPLIPGHPDYRIDICGNIYRVTLSGPAKRGCLPPHRLLTTIDDHGYRKVLLQRPCQSFDYIGRPVDPPPPVRENVHRLVARTFIGKQPLDKPWVCHMDGDTMLNHPANLYYGTGKDNSDDRFWHAEVGKQTPDSIRPQIRKLRARRIQKFGDPNSAFDAAEDALLMEDLYATYFHRAAPKRLESYSPEQIAPLIQRMLETHKRPSFSR